jgi:CDP-diacylglycerol--serine O-phosphatidyltransferase
MPAGRNHVMTNGKRPEERRRGTPRGRRPQLQRGIIILPSAFTLGNLFFGVYAMVSAAQGDLIWAAWFIVFASILDFADGRVARFTRTGSNFGAELDSLVDAISFGVAPAFIIYQQFLTDTAWGWILAYVYVAAIVVRLARFNVEQGGEAKTHFHGLPSPTAGVILASFYPFTQTPFFRVQLADMPWPSIIGVMTVIISVLMVSNVPYPIIPRLGFKTVRNTVGTAWVLGGLALAITVPRYYFFPATVLYTAFGLFKAILLGFIDRLPERDPLLDENEDELEEDDSGLEVRAVDYREVAPVRFMRRRPRDRAPEPADDEEEPGPEDEEAHR